MAYRRDVEDKKRLHKLFIETDGGWPAGCWFDKDKQRYFKYGKSKGKTSSWAIGKRLSRRALRRRANITGLWEKKADDLWWNEY